MEITPEMMWILIILGGTVVGGLIMWWATGPRKKH